MEEVTEKIRGPKRKKEWQISRYFDDTEKFVRHFFFYLVLLFLDLLIFVLIFVTWSFENMVTKDFTLHCDHIYDDNIMMKLLLSKPP